MQDLAAIKKFIENTQQDYAAFCKQAQEGFDYYDNKGRIKHAGAAAINGVDDFLKAKGANPLHSADNRVGLNLHSVVVDQKAGYLFSTPPSFDLSADETAKLKKPGLLGRLFGKQPKPQTNPDEALLQHVNDTVGTQWAKVVKQLGIDASNTGRAWLAYWQTQDKRFDYWFLNPLTVWPIYDRSSVKKRLQYLIRCYSYLDAGGNPVTRYEFWDDQEVAYLIRPQATSERPAPIIDFEILPGGAYNIQPHTYGRIPFIEFRNKAALLPDLPMYKDIIDAEEKVISGFCNDIDDLQEIIWVITNYAGQQSAPAYDKGGKPLTDGEGNPIMKPVDLLQMLKAQKWVGVDKDGGLDAVRGEVPYEARSKLLEILDAEFWIAAKAVNPNPPTAGNQSGVYISFLYGELEEKAGLMEAEFRSSIDEFLRAVLHYLGADETKQFVQTWKRTKPQNNTEISGIIAQTPDTVMSDETKTKVHPLIDDWQAERAQIEKEQAQKQENMLDQFGRAGGEQTPKRPLGEPESNRNDGGGENQ